jgi:hypothetical protein
MALPELAESALPRPEAEELQVRPDVRVSQLAARSWSVLGVGELHACGLSDDAISVRVDNGRLHPVHHGVYAIGHAAPPLEGCFLAAVKACGEAALLAGVAAGSHWEIMGWDFRLPEVLVAGRCAPRHPEITGHETSFLPPEDIRVHRGIPVTSPVRTLLDLAAILDHKRLRRAVRQAQSLGLVDLVELARRLRGPGPRRGRAKLRRIIATGPAPTRSELEDVVLDLLLEDGIAHPDVNVPLFLEGRRIVPDFRWPAQKLVIEADGAAWHDNQLAREDDAERQALLEAHGERVLRVSWEQAIARAPQTLRRVVEAGAPIAESAVPRSRAE